MQALGGGNDGVEAEPGLAEETPWPSPPPPLDVCFYSPRPPPSVLATLFFSVCPVPSPFSLTAVCTLLLLPIMQPDCEAEVERVQAVAAAASAAVPPRDITVGGFGVDSENPEVRCVRNSLGPFSIMHE